MGWVRVASWHGKKRTIAKVIPAGYSFSWHTRECFEYMHRQVTAQDAWVRQWPNSCEICGATGVTCHQENQAPLGSGRVWLEDICDVCVCVAPGEIEEMVCPRCAKELCEEIVASYQVPGKQRWLVDTYGNDGIIEAWLENEGMCFYCGWYWGKREDDFAPPGLDECGCWQREQPPEPAAPIGIQRHMFNLLEEWMQKHYKYPVKILRGRDKDD